MAVRRREDPAYALSRRYRMAPLVIGDRSSLTEGTWTLELAWDGHRVLAVRAGDRFRIVSPDFREWSDAFPGVVHALKKLASREVVIEGFLCALDDQGRPSFELLRERTRTKKANALFAVWDLLHVDGEDLRSKPLSERRARLATLVKDCGTAITVSEPIAGDVGAVLDATRTHGVPGVFARVEDAPYPSPDEQAWIAIPSGDASVAWTRSLSPPPVVTNEAKVLFPRDGYTKKDIVGYYGAIADVMLPHLAERPIVCQRWPDGIDDFTWYQHRIPPRAPDYLRGVWIEGNHRILIPTKDALLWMVNQAALTFHGWASRYGRLAEPDWVTLDLDPGTDTTWSDVIDVATAVRKLLELLEIPSVPKTSGQRGLHVMIPLARGHTPALAHEFARRAAMMIARLMPDKVSLDSEIEKRGGRLYLDHLQSFVGKSLVLAYSLRAADRAPVSTPLAWSEVGKKLDPKSLNAKTLRARVDAKGDLGAPLLAGTVQLAAAIAKM